MGANVTIKKVRGRHDPTLLGIAQTMMMIRSSDGIDPPMARQSTCVGIA